MMSLPEDIDDRDGLADRYEPPEVDLEYLIDHEDGEREQPEPEEELWTDEELDELEDC